MHAGILDREEDLASILQAKKCKSRKGLRARSSSQSGQHRQHGPPSLPEARSNTPMVTMRRCTTGGHRGCRSPALSGAKRTRAFTSRARTPSTSWLTRNRELTLTGPACESYYSILRSTRIARTANCSGHGPTVLNGAMVLVAILIDHRYAAAFSTTPSRVERTALPRYRTRRECQKLLRKQFHHHHHTASTMSTYRQTPPTPGLVTRSSVENAIERHGVKPPEHGVPVSLDHDHEVSQSHRIYLVQPGATLSNWAMVQDHGRRKMLTHEWIRRHCCRVLHIVVTTTN